MDMEQARYNMVEQQIRPWDVLNQSVLDLLHKVRREDFVPEAHRSLAFVDMEIPLGHGQAMWTPKLEARAIQELAIRPTDSVLEIGTGSGYLTALLASQAADVVSVDIVPEFTTAATQKLRAHGFDNIQLHTGDAARDWPDTAGFDVIVLTGSTPVAVGCVSPSPSSRWTAVRHRRRGPGDAGAAHHLQAPGAFRSVTLFETCVAPLLNAPHPAAFVF